jgi:hypothetical protein
LYGKVTVSDEADEPAELMVHRANSKIPAQRQALVRGMPGPLLKWAEPSRIKRELFAANLGTLGIF